MRRARGGPVAGGKARGLAVAAACMWVLGGGSPALATPDAPDLVIELAQQPYGGEYPQHAPVYLDPYEVPGRLLYRFDAVIRNVGGTLDVWRDPVAGVPIQGIWAGGHPDRPTDPSAPPPDDAPVTRSKRAASGARFEYAVEPSHEHWHFFTAARYELESRGEARAAGKVGFCFFDGFDAPEAGLRYFDWSRRGPDGETWCGFDQAEDPFVRMGLSPGAADRYASQREHQWVDITGLAPGPATLRGVANPYGHLEEGGATANNAAADARLIPGVILPGVTGSTRPGVAVDVPLMPEVIAPGVPVRAAPTCVPRSDSAECYRRHVDDSLLSFRIVAGPAHGAATFAGGSPRVLRYTPAPGFAGADTVAVVATDQRGLASAPATVRIEVAEPAPQAPAPRADPAAPAAASPVPAPTPANDAGSPPGASRTRLLRSASVRRRGRGLVLIVDARQSLTLSGRVTRPGSRRTLARLRPRAVTAGRQRVRMPRLTHSGRYALELFAKAGQESQRRRLLFTRR